MYMIRREAMVKYVNHIDAHGFKEAIDWDLIKFFPTHLLHPYGAYTLDGTSTIITNVKRARTVAFVSMSVSILVVLFFILRKNLALRISHDSIP